MKIFISNSIIQNFINKSMQTTLWGSTALQIDDDFYKNNPGPFIVIITSTMVKTFRGKFSINNLETIERFYIYNLNRFCLTICR
jgi:hypothetical protein